MSEKELPGLIIGGGIGGLAAAIALQKAGWPVRVFERVERLEEVGAGLTLWPNALKALQKLGLGQALQAMATPATEGGIYSWRGQKLTEFRAEDLAGRFGAVSVAVHRADLQNALRAALAPDTLQLGRRLERFDQAADGVTAYFEDGEAVRGSLLVGADGLHSAVRRQLFGPAQPRYSGYTAWRGVCPPPARLDLVGEIWGCGQRFGIVPLDQARIYWFATANRPAGQAEPPEQRQANLLKQFAGWPASVQVVLQATPNAAILNNDIYDRPPLTNWTAGRVTLLGDAAHPMTPNLGQGACQAIEDAVMLANCLQQTADIPQALRNYQAARLPRTSQVVNLSWRFGKVGQLQNEAICALRDLTLKLVPARLQLNGIAPIIGYEV